MGDERVQNNGKRSNERVRPEAWQIKFPKEFFRRNAGAPVPPAMRVAAGATEEEALRLIREAIVFHLEGLAEQGRRPPRPRAHAERVTVECAQPACDNAAGVN